MCTQAGSALIIVPNSFYMDGDDKSLPSPYFLTSIDTLYSISMKALKAYINEFEFIFFTNSGSRQQANFEKYVVEFLEFTKNSEILDKSRCFIKLPLADISNISEYDFLNIVKSEIDKLKQSHMDDKMKESAETIQNFLESQENKRILTKKKNVLVVYPNYHIGHLVNLASLVKDFNVLCVSDDGLKTYFQDIEKKHFDFIVQLGFMDGKIAEVLEVFLSEKLSKIPVYRSFVDIFKFTVESFNEFLIEIQEKSKQDAFRFCVPMFVFTKISDFLTFSNGIKGLVMRSFYRGLSDLDYFAVVLLDTVLTPKVDVENFIRYLRKNYPHIVTIKISKNPTQDELDFYQVLDGDSEQIQQFIAKQIKKHLENMMKHDKELIEPIVAEVQKKKSMIFFTHDIERGEKVCQNLNKDFEYCILGSGNFLYLSATELQDLNNFDIVMYDCTSFERITDRLSSNVQVIDLTDPIYFRDLNNMYNAIFKTK